MSRDGYEFQDPLNEIDLEDEEIHGPISNPRTTWEILLEGLLNLIIFTIGFLLLMTLAGVLTRI